MVCDQVSKEQVGLLVDRIIESLDPTDFTEAINWGDLGVVRVEQKETGFIVWIEEAAPGCCLFCEEVERQCFNKHGIDIDVITEW